MNNAWDFADVWVFAAIGVHGRRCSLTEVVASGDWINHAILSDVEMGTALGRLAGAGLVLVYDDWTFELTDDGASLWSDTRRDLRGNLDAVARDLAVVEPGATAISLPGDLLAEAVEEYRRHVDA